MEKANITIDKEKEFLKAEIKHDGMIGKMAFIQTTQEKK